MLRQALLTRAASNLTSRLLLPSSRLFSTTRTPHATFIVIARDGTDPSALQRRLTTRPDHLANVQKLKAAGHFILGGAITGHASNAHEQHREEDKMIGSVMIVEMENREAVEEYVRNDPYVKEGVWVEYEILPFKQAIIPS
ncbi:hypothetical protein PhCBS80983_g01086 [Powellomyces hirtus]|uniref:YCII-related domain-containing protein n=1 Tax=Powellomyces hirtus TaxID=109895 RepID=A0A507EBI2_9FUNG|nr:hypothetical protein PhCBS80983_g01086 [Powellomyces hirtus]